MAFKPGTILADLSHYEWPANLQAMADSGVVAVIWKATQGKSNHDPSYPAARLAAKQANLAWGAYHFGDASATDAQLSNFLDYAKPDPGDLICLDFEDNGSNTMTLQGAKQWIQGLERNLNRLNHTVLYSSNLIKEALGNAHDQFWAAHRLWLAQYTSGTPTWPPCWEKPWLWQFTDGTDGPSPHTMAGVNGTCDLNNYDGTPEELLAEWATGTAAPPAPSPQPPPTGLVVTVSAPAGVTIKVIQPNA